MKPILGIILSLMWLISNGQKGQDLPTIAGSEYIAQRLVELAWENDPESEVVRRAVDVARYDVKLSGLEWLNIISAQGNLNEFNIDRDRDVFNRSEFFPRYNVRANLSLGMLFTIPYTVRQNKEELKMARALAEDRKLAVRAQVLSLYNNYLLQERVYELQAEMSLDAENSFRLSKQQFSNGEIPFEQYSIAKTAYNEAQLAFYESEAAYRNAELALEELIGMELEEVQ